MVQSSSFQVPRYLQFSVTCGRLCRTLVTASWFCGVGTLAHSTKNTYCQARLWLGRVFMLVKFNPWSLKTDKAFASAPGESWSTVNKIKVFKAVDVDSDGLASSKASGVERFECTFLNIKKRVVFSALSSMFSSRTSTPWYSAAKRLAMAPLHSAVSFETISAAFEVEETSCRSTPLKFLLRKASHCPQACGCVYSLVIELYVGDVPFRTMKQ